MLESIGDTRVLYTWLVVLVALERGVEMLISRRNASRALRRGGVEVGAGEFRWMALMHAAFLVACPLEVWLLGRPWIAPLGWAMLALLGLTMALRYWVVTTLGERWNTRIICIPGAPLIETGPYRWMRHPNYLAVVLELIALPLIHGAWLSALVFGVCNALVLRTRIRSEDAALARYASVDALGQH